MTDADLSMAGPGARLRAARQQRGVSLAALAAQLKVSVVRLEALEGEQWGALPDPTHARALATSVCRVLELDPGPVLAGMPRAGGPALERVSAGLNQPVRDGGGGSWIRSWGVGLAALAAALTLGFSLGPWGAGVGALADAWLPGWLASDRAPASVSVPLPADVVPEPTFTATQPASALAGVHTGAQEAAVPMAGAAPTSAAPSPVTVPAAASVSATDLPVLTLRAERGASWVSVIDGKGASLVARLLQRGEAMDLPGEPPLRVTLGNAPVLSVNWRGQAQALDGYEGTRVARLELK